MIINTELPILTNTSIYAFRSAKEAAARGKKLNILCSITYVAIMFRNRQLLVYQQKKMIKIVFHSPLCPMIQLSSLTSSIAITHTNGLTQVF